MRGMQLLGTSFGGGSSDGGGVEELADGYYYVSMPVGGAADIDPESWLPAPDVHDGNLNAGYRTGSQGGTTARIAVLVAKEAGMSFDEVTARFGYTNTHNFDQCSVADTIVGPWEGTVFGSMSLLPSHLDSFAYEDFSASDGSVVHVDPHRYVLCIFEDTGGSGNEVGVADIRVKNGGVEVSP